MLPHDVLHNNIRTKNVVPAPKLQLAVFQDGHDKFHVEILKVRYSKWHDNEAFGMP